jgi:hypothetical protein
MVTDSCSGKFRLFRKDDWAKLPAMRWQITDLVPLHGVTLLFGQPKLGKKSFIGISQACAVATGKDWCGHKTRKGKVLVVVGEGFYGILRRQAAWEKVHGCSVGDNLRYLRVPVNFFSADDVKAALEALKEQGFVPDFIIIDTLARSMSGAKENATEDMSRVFELLETFRTALNDASILVVHHTTKDGLNYRGSSVIPAAVDGLIESKAKAKTLEITLTSAGFKDAPEFDSFDVRCESVAVETEDGWQEVLAVKERVTATFADIMDSPLALVSNGATQLLSVLAKLPGATFAEWEKASGLPTTTFKRYRKELVDGGYTVVGGKGRGAKYYVAPQPKSASDQNKDQLGPKGPPLRGVDPIGPNEFGANAPYLAPSGPLAPNTSCKNGDTTESALGTPETEPDLAAEAIKQIDAGKKKPA